MSSSRRHRSRRAPALIAALGLFLLGSNYCLLGALSGDTRMACMNLPRDASSAAVPACHRAASATSSESEQPPATPSCCPKPAVAPVTPVIEDADAAPSPLADAVFATVLPADSPDAIDPHGHPPAPDGEPPTSLTRAPVPARAPPLA